jgi:hypothetical protein
MINGLLDELANVIRQPLRYIWRTERAKRCFLIEERHRMYDEILCISLDMFVKDKIDATYKLPTKLFGIGDYVVVQDNDSKFQLYLVDTLDPNTAIKVIYSNLTA